MTDFNISFQTKKGRIDIYEGVDTVIFCQEEVKVIIPLEDWKAFYAAVEIANKKRKKS